jgi:hypothetical protein
MFNAMSDAEILGPKNRKARLPGSYRQLIIGLWPAAEFESLAEYISANQCQG